MNKAEFVTAVSMATGVSKKDAVVIISATFDLIQDIVSRGGDVSILGFGTFTRSERKARKGRNPSTGNEIDIEAKKVPVFKPGKGFKDMVNR